MPGTFTFIDPDPNFRVNQLETNTAVRMILQILNDSLAVTGGGSSGGGGSTVTTGTSFKSIADVVVDTANVRKQVPGQPSPRGVMITAALGNTGSVYVGGSGVTANAGSQRGIELTQAGTLSIVLPVATTDLIYINADNANDKVGIVIL